MSVKQAILDFADGEIRNKIFVTPGIPAKKLSAARSQFITRDEEVIVLYDDTVFGSGKDGIAITENYIYAKQLWDVPKSIKISSIRSISSQSKSLNSLEIYINGNLFITVTPPEKADHAFLIGILKAAKDVAAKPEKKKGKKAPAAEAPSPLPARSAPEAKSRSDASEEMRSCEECRAVLPTGAKFCLECGTKVMPKGICLECNAKLPEKARFCPECGTPAGKALAKAAEPKVDTAALRAELASWLSSAEQDASIDNDGDLTVSLNATAPAFAKDFRGWVAQYDLKISSEGVTEEISDSSFYGRDEEFFIRSPYRGVGKLASASYELATKLQVYTLQELEIHEIVLKDGALSIPKLGSTQVKIKTLSARRDDDGSYGVEYELEAYPNHVVHFEVLREKPDEEGGVWARVQEEDTQSGTSWLWDVEPGQKVYVCFGEYKPLVDGVVASFSGTAEPAGGAYANVDDKGSSQSSASLSDGAHVGKTYSIKNIAKKTFVEVISLKSRSGHEAIRKRIYRSGSINVTITNGDEKGAFDTYVSDDSEFDTGSFSVFELGHCDDLIEDDWWFENEHDSSKYKNIELPKEFYDLLDYIENEIGFSINSLNYKISDGGLNIREFDSSPPYHDDYASANSALQRLADKTEITLTSSGKLARYFSDCKNLFTAISIEHGPGNLLKVSVVVETDGQVDDLEEVEEAIGDYIFDTFLTAGLIEIFGDDAYEALEFEVHVKVAPLGDTTRSAQNVGSMPDSHAPNIIADYNNNVNVQKFLVKYKEFGRPAGQLDEELILLGFGTKGFSITQEDYDGVSQEDEWFGDLICDTILPLKMELGQIRVLGPCEVRCVFVNQISQKNEDDVLEVVNFYIIQFQCDTILLAIYGWYDQQDFSLEYYKIISTEGVHRTSATGYLSEMTEDLQAIGD